LFKKNFFLKVISYGILFFILYASVTKVNFQGPENSDKIFHIVMYFFACGAFYFLKIKKYYLYAICYGICLEIIQYFLPWRSFSFLDIIANAIGASLFYILIKLKKTSSF